MNVEILDCTLRDGGYINNWLFGRDNINMIVSKLSAANIDYIELGYIDQNGKDDLEYTKFNCFENIPSFECKNKLLCMIDYGKFPIEKVPPQKETNIWGIRIAFSKKNFLDAIKYAKQIKEKGYKVFVQPMVTLSYSVRELNILIDEVNKLEPYAIYFVDSFGSMMENDVIYLFNQYKEKLKNSIRIGFHAHNNLQLAYANAIAFIHKSNNNIIIDSSIYGMGRGAGNLPTELIIKYLNNLINSKKYHSEYLLEVVDNYLENLKHNKSWGYCLEYYLSAVYGCHPNYAKFLKEMHTMTIYDMQNILSKVCDDKKIVFDKEYIYDLYETYMNHKIDDKDSYVKLKKLLYNKKVLLLGNGESLNDYKDKIMDSINDNTIVISINNANYLFPYNYLFVSNKRRFATIPNIEKEKILCTSNINYNGSNAIVFDYLDNIVTEYEVSDNSLLMLLNILLKVGVKEVFLAGFDGFNITDENYYDEKLSYIIEKEKVNQLNELMTKYLKFYAKSIKINWITKSKYISKE